MSNEEGYSRLIEIADQAETIRRYMSGQAQNWGGIDDLDDLVDEAIPIMERLGIERELKEIREITRKREVGIPIDDWEFAMHIAASLRDACEEHELNTKIAEGRKARQESVKLAQDADSSPYGYVSKKRIDALRLIEIKKFDLRKLIRLCEELNICHANDCNIAIASLVRTITNHVPPIFGFNTYATFVSQRPSGRSVKSSLERLDKNLRDIADNHLHEVMGRRANLPTSIQVNFSPELDILLGEVEASANTHD